MSGIRLPDCPKLTINLKNNNDVTIFLQTSSTIFFEVALFLLSILVTGPSFMSISSLVLELWQFLFIRDWPEIRKSEIPPSEFSPKSGSWSELGIPNLARMFLIKCYWMLQNSIVTAFTISELLKENQQEGKTTHPHPGRLGLRVFPKFPKFPNRLSLRLLPANSTYYDRNFVLLKACLIWNTVTF